MKANKVLEILKTSRSRLTAYVQDGDIKVTVSDTGRYDYDEDSVYQKAGYLEQGESRRIVLYTRVSSKDEEQLAQHILDILDENVSEDEQFRVHKWYDCGSSEWFRILIEHICRRKIKKVIVDDIKSFYGGKNDNILKIYEMLFQLFDCELEVIDCSDENKSFKKNDDIMISEIVEDLAIVKNELKNSNNSELLDVLNKVIKLYKLIYE